MWQHLEDLHNTMNQYLLNNQYTMFQVLEKVYVFMCIPLHVKDLLKVQDRAIHFNVKKYRKLSDKISDSTVQLPLADKNVV